MKPGILEHWTDWLRLFGLTVCIYVVAAAWIYVMVYSVVTLGK